MKQILFLLMILLLAGSVFGIEIDNQDISVVVGHEKTKNFSITNNHDFDYYNIEFLHGGDFDIQDVSFIAKNSTIIHDFTALTNDTYSSVEEVQARFLKKVEINPPSSNYSVEVADNFTPGYLEVHSVDYVKFTNVGISNHTVTDAEGGFNYELESGEYITLQFSENTTVYDKKTLETINIAVIEPEEQYVHDSDLDVNFTINMTSTYEFTNVSLTLLENKLTSDYNGSISSTLIIQNGDNKAYSVHLSGADEFSRNDFDLAPGKAEIIDYELSFDFVNDADTNKTHEFQISVAGDNFDTVSKILKIFINEADIDEEAGIKEICSREYGNLDNIWDKQFYKAFCTDEGIKTTEVITDTIIKEVEKTYDVSGADIKENNQRAEALEKAINQRIPDNTEAMESIKGLFQSLKIDITNSVNELNSSYQGKITNLEEKLNEYEKQDRKQKVKNILTFIGITLVAITGLVLLVAKHQGLTKLLSSGG